jgi:hypothetical protein
MVVLKKPISHQGVMNTQEDLHPSPPQMGQYQNASKLEDQNILLTSEEEILLKTCGHQYNAPPASTPTTSEASPYTVRQPLMIMHRNKEPPIHIPHISL